MELGGREQTARKSEAKFDKPFSPRDAQASDLRFGACFLLYTDLVMKSAGTVKDLGCC